MNRTNLTAEPGKQEVSITNIFDAPVNWCLRRTRTPNSFRSGGDRKG